MPNDGEKALVIFQENVMTSTHTISKSLPQHLGDTANVLEEVTVVGGSPSEDDYVDNLHEEEKHGWDDLETDAEDDYVHIQCHLSEEESDSDNGDTINNEDDEKQVDWRFHV